MISTKIIKVNPERPQQNYLREAADILRSGGLVIMPTETVYGIAANMLNKEALDRLYEIKNRPKDKPFSLHIAEKHKIEEFASSIPVSAYKLIDKFWPGPLTLILESKDNHKIGTSTSSLDFARDDPERVKRVEGPLSANGKRSRTIGMRMPDNEIALRLITQANVPVVCPSANISGRPAPTNFEQAIKDMQGLVDFAIDSGSTKLGLESSVVDLTVVPPKILREGAIKKEDILKVLQKKTVLFVCTGNSCRSVMAKALLEKRLQEKKRDDVEVLSAGIMMLSGLGATEPTKELLKREGVDISGHRSRRVTPEMVKKSDIILVMERLQEKSILKLAPEVKLRLFLLKEFAKISNNGFDISDPIGKSMEFYENTFRIIKEAIERISNII